MASMLFRFVILPVVIVAIIFITILGLLSIFQEKCMLMYYMKSPFYKHPHKNVKDVWLPSDLGMIYNNITIQSPVKKGANEYYNLSGWFVHHEEISNSVPTIVYFHENDYFPPARLHMIHKLYSNPAKCNVIMVDYRGYGLSEGTPTIETTLLDAHAIMDYVLSMKEIDQTKLYIFGASYGGSVAIYSATQYQQYLKGLIIQNTFTSFKDTVEVMFSFIKPIVPILVKLDIPSDKRIDKLTLPIMYIVGLKDDLTPPWMMMKLHNSATHSIYKKYYEIQDADHYSTWYHGGELFDEKLQLFMESCDRLFNQHIKELRNLISLGTFDEKDSDDNKKEDL